MKRPRIQSLSLVAVVVAGCADRHAQQVAHAQAEWLQQSELPVTTLKTKAAVSERQLELIGSVEAQQEATVTVEAPGQLAAVLTQEGARVTTGQLLAIVHSGNITPTLQAAEAQVSAAQSRLRTAQRNRLLIPSRSRAEREAAAEEVAAARAVLAELQNGTRPEEVRTAEANVRTAQIELQASEREWKRHSELAREGAIAESVVDELATRRDVAQAALQAAEAALQTARRGPRTEQISQARARVRQAEASLRAADAAQRMNLGLQDEVAVATAELQAAVAQRSLPQDALRRTRLIAPFSGRVLGKPLAAGITVQPGEPVLRLVADDRFQFEAPLPQAEAVAVRLGAPVTIRIEGLDQTFSGKIADFSPVSDQRSRSVTVRIPIPGDPRLRPGMFGRATVILRRTEGVRVPTTAVQDRDRKPFVWIREGQTARRTPLTVLEEEDRTLLVKGLPAGAEVIVGGAGRLTGKEPLRFEEESGSWD